ncbi:element excision factor XisI family protein [uncultured Nostoc sp.]
MIKLLCYVPKQDIVLGFHPPFMREMSNYAVG